MHDKINNLKELADELKKESVLENVKIDFYKKLDKLFVEIYIIYEESKIIEDRLKERRIKYYERKMNTETGIPDLSLLGEGTFIGTGIKHNESSAIIKTEDGNIINYLLDLVKFIR